MDRPTRKISSGPWLPGHLGEEGRCQCKSVVNEEYMGAICTVRVENSEEIGSRSIAEGFNDAPPRNEAIANMRFIALAGTVANQLYDSGLDGIEAVKALPEFYHKLVNCRAALTHCLTIIPDSDPLFQKVRATEEAAKSFLARLKGDAE